MMKAEAVKYISGAGMRDALSIFPLSGKRPLTSHGWKDASRDRRQIEDWWSEYPDANIGIATGEINGLLVIDVDIKHDQGKFGDESLEDLETELGNLPHTWTALTGSGGLHYYFKYPKGHEIRNSVTQLAPGIDVRANGGYIVAPPSIHPETGQQYTWECMSEPEETELANIPEAWLRRLEGTPTRETFIPPERVPQGKRNDTLFRYGASLRAKREEAIQIFNMMRQYNEEKCFPPVPVGELKKIYNSVMRYPEGQNEIMNSRNQDFIEEDLNLNQFHHLDKNGNATSVYDFRIYEHLIERGGILILGGVPYMYSGGVYRGDVSGANLKTEIRKLIYPEMIKSSTIERVYRLFLSEADLQVTYQDLNAYPLHWINFRNGFYDPIEKRMIPHDPKYRAVNQIPHEYHPGARLTGDTVESWLRFIVPKDDDREMLLQFMGYCLTRDTRQQKFLILYGAGGTGKSTAIKMLESMIGLDNISNISLKELSERFASYGLLGKLLNSCADLELTALEDTSVIKKVLGEDSLRGEPKGKDSISFRNYAKLIFSTNELPLVRSEKTNGFFRRLMILNMTRQPEGRKADFLESIQREMPYLIRLAVEALERLYASGGIAESAGSREAVRSLRNDSDSVEAFISEMCTRMRGIRTERSRLFNSYEEYCYSSGRKALLRNSFYRALRTKDFGEISSNGQRYFEGLSLGKTALENSPTPPAAAKEADHEPFSVPF